MKYLSINDVKYSIIFVLLMAVVTVCTSGCTQGTSNDSVANLPQAKVKSDKNITTGAGADVKSDDDSEDELGEDTGTTRKSAKRRKTTRENMIDLNVELEENFGKMITYDVPYMTRGNPFMPRGEEVEYQSARSAAIKEANEKNAQIIKIKKMQNYKIREKDDISPYSFNLPVPPTSPGAGSTASRITKTKVVGIMYNEKSPSAIINVDNKDYLVRPGDKIIGQEYIVTKINPTWVTAAMGPNVYSAAIGELFSKDGIEENQTDIYDLKNRFGGRKI